MKSWLLIILALGVTCIAQAQTPASPGLPIVNDPELSDYLTALVNDVSIRANNPINSVVIVIDSDSVNAYALPSGELCVTRGLIKAVTNEAEIRFVIAQQLVTLQLHRQPLNAQPVVNKPAVEHSVAIGLLSGALIAFGGPVGGKVGAIVIAQELGHRSNSRALPVQAAPAWLITEADKAAVEYLHEAGYDPEAALSLLEKLRALRPKGYVQMSQRPAPLITFVERMRLVRNQIAKLERKPEYLMDSSTFKALKKRYEEKLPTADKKLRLIRNQLTSSNQR